jgi:hypothetical protein
MLAQQPDYSWVEASARAEKMAMICKHSGILEKANSIFNLVGLLWAVGYGYKQTWLVAAVGVQPACP